MVLVQYLYNLKLGSFNLITQSNQILSINKRIFVFFDAIELPKGL
jgi:hypothetical protein